MIPEEEKSIRTPLCRLQFGSKKMRRNRKYDLIHVLFYMFFIVSCIYGDENEGMTCDIYKQLPFYHTQERYIQMLESDFPLTNRIKRYILDNVIKGENNVTCIIETYLRGAKPQRYILYIWAMERFCVFSVTSDEYKQILSYLDKFKCEKEQKTRDDMKTISYSIITYSTRDFFYQNFVTDFIKSSFFDYIGTIAEAYHQKKKGDIELENKDRKILDDLITKVFIEYKLEAPMIMKLL